MASKTVGLIKTNFRMLCFSVLVYLFKKITTTTKLNKTKQKVPNPLSFFVKLAYFRFYGKRKHNRTIYFSCNELR